MATVMSASGSAGRWGPIWGARPEDWAAIEEQQIRTYEEAIRRVGVPRGGRVLEVGCGSGVFLRAAADRGAQVSGLDASDALLAIARARVPEADLRVADMQFLPYEDDAFDLVVGFNSFFFAANMIAALREAGRVAKPGAPVVIQVWGRPERCDLTVLKDALAPFLPPPPPGAPALWEAGVLESIAADAGLTPIRAFDAVWAFEFHDEETLARQLRSAANAELAARTAGEEPVRRAIVGALERFRTPAGTYRLENEWHYLHASA
jgi:SAM-dependent methyltransferase